MSEDMRTKQWFVKVSYGNTLLEVKEIWADTEQQAHQYGHKLAVSSLETQLETPKQTEERLNDEIVYKLQAEASELSEFLHDDYGDTVDQVGIEKVRELETKLEQLREEIRERIRF